MHYVQAIISIGFFGWLGYAIAFDALPASDGGSSKTRALMAAVDKMTTEFGPGLSGMALVVVGFLLAAFFIRRGSAYEE